MCAGNTSKESPKSLKHADTTDILPNGVDGVSLALIMTGVMEQQTASLLCPCHISYVFNCGAVRCSCGLVRESLQLICCTSVLLPSTVAVVLNIYTIHETIAEFHYTFTRASYTTVAATLLCQASRTAATPLGQVLHG